MARRVVPRRTAACGACGASWSPTIPGTAGSPPEYPRHGRSTQGLPADALSQEAHAEGFLHQSPAGFPHSITTCPFGSRALPLLLNRSAGAVSAGTLAYALPITTLLSALQPAKYCGTPAVSIRNTSCNCALRRALCLLPPAPAQTRHFAFCRQQQPLLMSWHSVAAVAVNQHEARRAMGQVHPQPPPFHIPRWCGATWQRARCMHAASLQTSNWMLHNPAL